MIQDWLTSVWGGAYAVMFAGVIASVLELTLPAERQGFRSRAKGAAFWMLYLLIGNAAVLLAQGELAAFHMTPLVHWDLQQTIHSQNWIVMGLGLTVLPFSGLFVFDFFYYWFHRLQHVAAPMWHLHAVHHSLEEVNAFNCYHHPTEDLLRIPLIVVPMAFLIQVDPPVVLFQMYFLRIAGQYIHANTRIRYGPFRYLFSEPVHHRIHHSAEPKHWNKNFAAFFPVWDVLFGTAHFAKKGEFPRTGVPGRPEPVGLKTYLIPPRVRTLL